MVGFSSYPYTNSPLSEFERRARRFSFSFKNGRGCRPLHPTFADVVRFIAAGVVHCPTFAQPSVLVPIPRSGSSRVPFGRNASTWPASDLADEIAQHQSRHQNVQLIKRRMPVQRSSDGPRVSVREHVMSIAVHARRELLDARLVLIDDLLTKGTQAMACVVALRAAGYTGTIEAYFVHQTIAPKPSPLQRQSFLVHRIRWSEADLLASRDETGRWRSTL